MVSLPKYPAESDLWTYLADIDKPIVVYGMGNGADKLIARLEKFGKQASDFFASDGFVRGHSFHGKRVLSFSEVKEKYTDFVVLLSFATSLSDVMDNINKIAEEYELYVPDMPVVDTEYFTCEFYNEHYSEIKEAYELLCDDFSKNLFASIINYKLSGRPEYLKEFTSKIEEMYQLLDTDSISVAVDAGAYNGDTIKEMRTYFKNINKIYAIEPDPKNCKKLTKLAQATDECDIQIFECALWDKNSSASFSSSNNRNSSLINASHERKEISVPTATLDTLVSEKIDFIKYDVEGAELEALSGSFNTINDHHPSLLISAYHKSEDIFSLINYMKKMHESYKFYLRRKPCFPAWEINIYAIPK